MQPKGGFRPLSAEPFYGAGDDGEAGHTWKFDDAYFNITPQSYTYVWYTRMIRRDSDSPEPPLVAKPAHVDRKSIVSSTPSTGFGRGYPNGLFHLVVFGWNIGM